MELFFKRKIGFEKCDDWPNENLKTNYNIQVCYLCFDNTGKSVDFERAYKQDGMELEFEYTTQGSYQQNSWVKHKFATLFNWICAMINGRKFSSSLRNSAWVKADNTGTLLENNLVTPNRDLSPFQQFFGKEKRNILSFIQKFSEIWITMYQDNPYCAKLAN